MDSQSAVIAAKNDPFTTLEIVIGHCMMPPNHHAWFVGLIATFPEECTMTGTTVIGCETSSDMMDAYLTQYRN